MMKDTRIIDLSKTDYSDATICDEINLIHKSKMQEILDVWHKLYSQCDSRSVLLENDTDEVHSVHNTISIFGSRGAGKTTFLLSFLKRIKDEDKKSELLLLNRIDPTHIEINSIHSLMYWLVFRTLLMNWTIVEIKGVSIENIRRVGFN